MVPDAWLRDTPLVVLSAAPAVVPVALGHLPAAAHGRGFFLNAAVS